MQFGPVVSEAEIRTVQDGIANGVRSDGRSLTQRRPFTVVTNRGSTTHFEGSSVEVQCDGTTVVAAATPSVVELDIDRGQAPRGSLFVNIDAVPAVVEHYAQSVRNNSARYRQAFLSFLATAIRQTFGAQGVTAEERQQQLGIAEAEIIADEGDDEQREDALGGRGAAEEKPVEETAEQWVDCCGFPGEQLYIGGGYAFRIDVDAHVLQAHGGSLASIVALAVHAALKTVRLPSVTLHEASAGFSLEVDYSKPYATAVNWSRLPVLSVVHVSPTRHYVVDPTRLEELALPQQLRVAVNSFGQVFHMRFQQLPSRRGNAMRLIRSPWEEAGKDNSNDNNERDVDGDDVDDSSRSGFDAGVKGTVGGMNMPDMAAVLHAAVHISQAVIAECDEALAGSSG